VDKKLQALTGRKIRQFRLEDGLTIEELAFRAQLHPNYLGDIERGTRNPSLANLKKIADGLKKPLAGLFAGSGGPGIAVAGPSTREKAPVYLSTEREGDLIALVRILRNNSKKDRKHIIQIAKSLSSRLKTG